MAAEPGPLAARLALGWLIAGEAKAHPGRFLATAIAIAVGVALGFAVHLVNGSALASFESAVGSVNGAAALQVRGATPLGFDERLYPKVARAAGVADASPVVSVAARAGPSAFTLLGLDVLRAVHVTPTLLPGTATGLLDPHALFLSRAALAAAGAAPGDTLTVEANGHTAAFRIAGTLPGVGGEQSLGLVDIAAAQADFGRLGRLDRIDLAVTDRDAAEAALRRLLPAEAVLASGASRAAQGDALSRAYRVNLDMLALVALLTGGFLVFSAQSLAVARRLRLFALLRTLGLPRGGILAAVAAEGAAIGLVGAAAGLAAGYGVAALALKRFGGDLGAGYFAGGHARIAFQPTAAAGFFLLGLAAAFLGSVLPARAAARAAPAAALKNAGDPIDPRAPVPWAPAVALLAAGGIAALLPPIGGLPIAGFASMALMLAGGVAGVPWLARRLLAPLARAPMRGVGRLLAVRHLHGAPGEATAALCGIVASTALMIAMATMVTSFRAAVDQWLGQVLSADLYLRDESGAGFGPEVQAALARVPGVGAIQFSRQISLTLAPDRPPVTLIARPIGGASPLVLLDAAKALPAGAIPLWASEPAARLYHWRMGETIALPIAPGRRFAIAGIWRDYARQHGALVLRTQDYTALTGDRSRDEAAVTLAPHASRAAVRKGLAEALPPPLRTALTIAAPATLRHFALQLFDRSFAVTYVLEAVAILVGLAGVAATMSAQTIARTREFGMLRHLGVAKRQIWAMLGLEGALLGAVGGIAGVGLGALLSQVLIHVINPQSFHLTMATRAPGRTVLAVVAALVVASAGTALLAGRRATARDAVLAVREDW